MNTSWKLWLDEFRQLDNRFHVNGEELEGVSAHRYSFLRNVIEAGLGTKQTLQEDNRRREPRIPVSIPAEIEWEDSSWSAFTVNVSWGGVQIDDPPPLERGQKLKIRLVMEREGMEFYTEGRVVWKDSQSMGIAFSEPPPEQLQALGDILHAFIRERLIKNLGRMAFEGRSSCAL